MKNTKGDAAGDEIENDITNENLRNLEDTADNGNDNIAAKEPATITIVVYGRPRLKITKSVYMLRRFGRVSSNSL